MKAEIKKIVADRKELFTYLGGVTAALVSAGILHGNALALALTVESVATGVGIHQASNQGV